MWASLRTESRQRMIGILLIGGLGIALVGVMLLMQLQRPTIIALTPRLTGQTEYCLTCHTGIEDISASHTTADFGCVLCHGGDGQSIDEATAHQGMVTNPSSLDNAQQYCGDCHGGQVLTVQRDIMNTYAGAITLIRRAFGLQTTGQAEYGAVAIGDLKLFDPASTDPQPVKDFAANCQTCHLSSEPQPTVGYYRATGCATCHVIYNDNGLYQGGDPTISKTEPGHPQTHQFTTAIPYTQCNHCHNQGNYDLRTMTFVPRDDLPPDPSLTGDALRLHNYYQPIAQFTRCEYELDCIDCHTSQEIMGDGLIYNNRTEAVYTQCQTCHGTLNSPPQSITVQSSDDLALKRANLNPNVDLSVGDTILVTNRSEPLYNIRLVDGQWILTGKATGTTYVLPLVQGSLCQQDPNNQSSASCHQCHSVDRATSP